MKRILFSLLLVAGLGTAVRAEDLITNNGTIYPNIQIIEITPIGINFVSNNNAGWVDFRDLPPATAAHYGYDPAKAAAFEQTLTQNNGSAVAANSPVTVPAAAVTSAAPATTIYTPPAATTGYTTTTTTTTTTAVSTVAVPISTVAAPPAGAQVIMVRDLNQMYYDESLSACLNVAPNAAVWVLWNGCYYPAYWWNYWFWSHHYIYYGNRYYPAQYFHRYGLWCDGYFYQYHVPRNVPFHPAPLPLPVPPRGHKPMPIPVKPFDHGYRPGPGTPVRRNVPAGHGLPVPRGTVNPQPGIIHHPTPHQPIVPRQPAPAPMTTTTPATIRPVTEVDKLPTARPERFRHPATETIATPRTGERIRPTTESEHRISTGTAPVFRRTETPVQRNMTPTQPQPQFHRSAPTPSTSYSGVPGGSRSVTPTQHSAPVQHPAPFRAPAPVSVTPSPAPTAPVAPPAGNGDRRFNR